MFILVITAHGYQNIEELKHRRRTRSGAQNSRDKNTDTGSLEVSTLQDLS